MTTRLKIDLSQGVLEVEGSETFVKTIYNDFKAHFIQPDEALDATPPVERPRRKSSKAPAKAAEALPPEPKTTVEPVILVVESPAVPEAPPAAALPEPALEPKAPAPAYNLIESLELGATSNHPSLVEFMDSKLPITNEERNLVFLYYLQHILKLKPIGLDHIYTCYRAAKIRAPLNLENSLRLTAEQRGWIKTGQNGSMTLTPEGKQYAEKQLPKKVKN